MSEHKPIRFAFNTHGLGDCVHAATAMRLYKKRGYDVQIQVEANKRWVWEAAGIPIYEGPEQLPIHPYYYPDSFFDLHKADCIHSKIAHLFDIAELPKLGTKEEVWRMICEEKIDASHAISERIRQEVEVFIKDLPKPIILLHSKGTNWQEKKSIPDDTAFSLIRELVSSFDGSVVILDWDRRAPTLGHERVKTIYPYWNHMSLEHFGALCELSDLLIGVDSGPFHLAGWFDIPTLYVSREIPPVRCCLPSPRATYLVPAADHENWSTRGLEWRFAEFRGTEAPAQDITFVARSIIDKSFTEKAGNPMSTTQQTELAGTYIYRRVGHDQRELELLPNGQIGKGAAGCERVWKIEQTPIGFVVTIYGDHGGPTCHLQLGDDGVFRGRWLSWEKMPIELVPTAASTAPTPLGPYGATGEPRAMPATGFVVGIPTLNRFDLIGGCIDSILAGSAVPDAIYVIDNSCGRWKGHPSPLVQVITPQYNLGCSRSWNLLMQLVSPKPMIILSDDIEIGHNMCERMLSCNADFVVADGKIAMVAFMIRPAAWAKIGKFDEAIYPIYHEDNDWCRRAYVADIGMACPLSDGFRDHGPSATKQALTRSELREWDRLFATCRAYYVEKWGGLPHQETFDLQFNGDPAKELEALMRMNGDIDSSIAAKRGAQS